MNRITLLFAAALTAPATVCAQSGSWPTKPVRMIVSQAAGSAPDIICRLMTDCLAKVFGQAIVVDNRPGAANVIGAQAAARSAPDGYTFFCATAETPAALADFLRSETALWAKVVKTIGVEPE